MISNDTIQDAYSAVRGFRVLSVQQFFEDIERNEYVVWCEPGKHLRNNELIAYLMQELPEENIHGNNTFSVLRFTIKHSMCLK